MQTLQKSRAPLLLPAAALALVFVVAGGGAFAARAQDAGDAPRPQPAPRADLNHEVQMHVLVTAEGVEGAPRVPQSLDGIVRQLKSALPPSDYRLAATFINRVRDGGTLEFKSAGAAAAEPGRPQPPPLFFQFVLAGIKLLEPASSGAPSVNVQQFRLGMRVPIQTASVAGEKGGSYPVIQYEDVGLTTQLSVREGEPTLVGMLNSSRPSQLFVVVITIKRAGR